MRRMAETRSPRGEKVRPVLTLRGGRLQEQVMLLGGRLPDHISDMLTYRLDGLPDHRPDIKPKGIRDNSIQGMEVYLPIYAHPIWRGPLHVHLG